MAFLPHNPDIQPTLSQLVSPFYLPQECLISEGSVGVHVGAYLKIPPHYYKLLITHPIADLNGSIKSKPTEEWRLKAEEPVISPK